MEFKILEESLIRLDFHFLDSLFEELDFIEFEQILYRLAYDPDTGESNIFVYTYMLRLLELKEDLQKILSNPV